MAKRGYKLQEFVAHSGNVNCLRIGKKTCRQFLTGGDDQVVNLWSVGKPEPLTSLIGQSSPIESVAFDSAEVLVVAGASSGAIKLWDLEEAKVIHSLTGHRSYCTAVEFHPFGEFLASGSIDTNLKIWDIRKNGCTHTYKGHSRGISTMRFSPDGRWVVSGGCDNAVKVWDLTAGKLLHDFKLHEGHIRSLEFHPFEFLLATGSADRTVKFWDLETFEMIGSTRCETAGVRSMKFHPDGKSLFCALDGSLKVYSWEPVICHDSVDMGWPTIGDLCVHDGKLLGGAYYENSVGVWVVDMSVVQLFDSTMVPNQNGHSDEKVQVHKIALVENGNHRRSTSNPSCTSPDTDSKDIKNIYVDSESPVSSKKVGSPKVMAPPHTEEIKSFASPVSSKKVGSPKVMAPPHTEEIKSFASPVSSKKVGSPKDMAPPHTEEIKSFASPKQGSGAVLHVKPNGSATNKSFVVPIFVPRDCQDSNYLAGSRRDSLSTARVNAGTSLRPANTRKALNTKFDKETVSTLPDSGSFGNNTPTSLPRPGNRRKASTTKSDAETVSTAPVLGSFRSATKTVESKRGPMHVRKPSSTKSDVENVSKALEYSPFGDEETAMNAKKEVAHVRKPSSTKFNMETTPMALESGSFGMVSTFDSKGDQNCKSRLMSDSNARDYSSEEQDLSIKTFEGKLDKLLPLTQPNLDVQHDAQGVNPVKLVNGVVVVEGKTRNLVKRFEKREVCSNSEARSPDATLQIVSSGERASTTPPSQISVERTPAAIDSCQPVVGREEHPALNENHVVQNLMQNHDVLLSTLSSRLAKLQMVRHFWERNDVKGAMNAMKNLTDRSVQSDVVSLLIERVDVITLDLFSCLLPVLLGLLDGKVERHTTVSLEMLLKLVAVFGHLVRSTVSANPAVGVDLHAEQRLEICKDCFVHLQSIQKILPTLTRRGGELGRYALQLNLLLQQT